MGGARRAGHLIRESARLHAALADSSSATLSAAADRVAEALREGSRVLTFGNGGSAADAQHIAAELTGRLARERDPLPAIALTTNASEVTAIANDYGFEQVFARLVRAHARPGDVALAISTSGNSANVIRAVETARELGAATVGLTGAGGGKLAPLVDLAIVVPSDDTQRIQECHITIGHVLCQLVEEALFGSGDVPRGEG